jgi:hypothetical protein
MKKLKKKKKNQQACNTAEYNSHTKLFFLIHSLISFFIVKLDREYMKILTQYNELIRTNSQKNDLNW